MNSSAPDPLALICSVALEAEPIRALLQHAVGVEIGRKAGVRGLLDDTPVLLLPIGMGKTNAAQGLTALLERQRVRGVLALGVGGAYPGSGLEVGEVALASSEIYGDEGVAAPEGWLSTEGIGIPLLEREGRCAYNEFVLDAERVRQAERTLRSAEVRFRAGAFVTVSCCSGTLTRGRELAERFGAVCESMEGAALAHVSALYDVPFLEVRGISNPVEDRDLSRWRLHEAAEAAAQAIRILVRVWP